MTFERIDQEHSMRPRLELLLIAQMELRHHPHANPSHLFEVTCAIDELSEGQPTSHTECVERWVGNFLAAS